MGWIILIIAIVAICVLVFLELTVMSRLNDLERQLDQEAVKALATDLTPEKRDAISNEMKAWVRARQPRPHVDPIDSVMVKLSVFFGAVIICLIAWWAIWGTY